MNNQAREVETPGKFTGWHMAMIMVAFFGVIITVNGYMAYVATTSWTGIMARNGYVASQDFNATLARQRQQDSLGFQSLLRYDNEMMTFSFNDSASQPLVGFDITLKVGRPVHENDDRQIVLEEGAPGVYHQKLKLAPGQWNVDVIANDNADRRYHRRLRLYVKK